MKKISLFSFVLTSATTCVTFLPTISSCSDNNDCKISISNNGFFDLTQKTVGKGDDCEITIYDKNSDEKIVGIKSIKINGKDIDENSWNFSLQDKKSISVFVNGTVVINDLDIELDVQKEEDVYDELIIETQGVRANVPQLLEGQDATIVFTCDSTSKIVDSISRINTYPGSITEDFYEFDYETQTLTIQGSAVHSDSQMICISLNVADKLHKIKVSCEKVDVYADTESVEHKGKLNTKVFISQVYQQTFVVSDVVVKIGSEALSRSQYTWLIDAVHPYSATVTTNDGVEVTDSIEIVVYVSETTSNLFNVFITDGAYTEESPKAASQVAGLIHDLYNPLDESRFRPKESITITAVDPQSGNETVVDPSFYTYKFDSSDPNKGTLELLPGGVQGNIYIRKHILSDKNFYDSDWVNLCHFANGGLDVLKEFYNEKDSFVGKIKKLPWKNQQTSSWEDFTVKVIGENHDFIAGEKDKKAALTFEFEKTFTIGSTRTFVFANDDFPANGWRNKDKDSYVRHYLNSTDEPLYKGLPDWIKNDIKTIVKKRVTDQNHQGTLEDVEDKFFILSPYEVNCGETDKYPVGIEGSPDSNNVIYEWYKKNVSKSDGAQSGRKKYYYDSSSTIKYWLSSRGAQDSKGNSTIYIDTDGSIKVGKKTDKCGLAPVFCI